MSGERKPLLTYRAVEEKLHGGRFYVQCGACRKITIVPGEESTRLVDEHLKLFPDHYGVIRGNAAANLYLYLNPIYNYNEVGADGFNCEGKHDLIFRIEI